MDALPGVLDMLQYFETILPSVESLDLLNKERYILWLRVLLEACEAPTMVEILAAILDLTKNKVKTARNGNYLCFT